MMRLFVALELPEAERGRLARLQRGLRGARWVGPEALHLTLRFIGEVDGRQAEDIDAALTTLRFDAFPLVLAGVGRFGEGRKLRALWVGVEENPMLLRLQTKIEQLLQRAGLSPEARKFKPHITLARFKGGNASRAVEFLAQHALFRGEAFLVRQVILYSSFLGQSGALHRAEALYELITEGGRASSRDG
jgi:2'-5' RNA ligase